MTSLSGAFRTGAEELRRATARAPARPMHYIVRTNTRSRLPYLFERNPRRWGHDRFVLVNRDYRELAGTEGVTKAQALDLVGDWLETNAVRMHNVEDSNFLPFYDDRMHDGGHAHEWAPRLVRLYERAARKCSLEKQTAGPPHGNRPPMDEQRNDGY